MCMMCEEEAMYQAYLDYLARKAAEQGAKPASGEDAVFAPQTSAFACDPAPGEADDDAPLAPASAKAG